MSETDSLDLTRKDSYAHWTQDLARYGDTDRQGHVNNAAFATFLESGRVSILYDPSRPLAPQGTTFVIARLLLEFRSEIHWGYAIDIGTLVLRVGSSSVTLGQGLFVGDRCVATAETVIVLMDDSTRRSSPLPDATRAELKQYEKPLADTAARPRA